MKLGTILVVGAGFAGATYARELADHGWHVDIIDRRPHIAGNAFDEVDETGVRRHVYGPHIFHTNNARVMAWVRRFATFVPYEHRVSAMLPDGRRTVPLPINRTTINTVFGLDLQTTVEVRSFLERQAVPHPSPSNAADYLQAQIGAELTDLFFRTYTKKMWGRPLEELDASVVARIPLRLDDESRYFPDDRYQGLPSDGYTALVGRVLDHPGICVATGVAFRRALLAEYAFCFNSMAIDEFFDFAYGPLAYRSLRFHHREEPSSYALAPTALTNFTNNSIYTRQTDWSLLPGHLLRDTGAKTITLEEPCDDFDNGMERYYPVPASDGSQALLYATYKALADREPNLRFIGRCGAYRYLNMDQVINQSLAGARAWLSGARQ